MARGGWDYLIYLLHHDAASDIVHHDGQVLVVAGRDWTESAAARGRRVR